MHFTCIWVNLSRFKMIITSGCIEDINTQEKLNLQVLIPPRYLSIYQDLIKLDTSRSVKLRDF